MSVWAVSIRFFNEDIVLRSNAANVWTLLITNIVLAVYGLVYIYIYIYIYIEREREREKYIER
jgi:hypothetical protein